MSRARDLADIADYNIDSNLTFGDNDKAIFGAGDDLQIYHDSNNSYIQDAGTGSLFLQATNLILRSNGTNENYMRGIENGTVELYHNGIKKIETTATGVDVTGDVTATGSYNASTTGDLPTILSSGSFGGGIGLRDGTVTSGFFAQSSGTQLKMFVGQTASDAANSKVVLTATSSGNVGIGITPFANSIGKGLDTANGAGMFGSSNSNYVTANLYYNSGWKYKASASGSLALLDGTGSIKFYNAPAGSAGAAATVTERMRIDSSGDVLIGKSSSALSLAGHEFLSSDAVFHTRDSSNVLYINRLTNDGTLVAFYQDTSLEGLISVSGTTVSYNGGHLARWSQLTDGTKDETIVKGTVLTNLDQMAVWHHEAVAATYYVEGDELPEITPATYYTEDDTLPEGVSVGDEKTAAVYAQIGDEKTPAADAYTEDNEQLNCMAVSSVEGDPNVAGVFVNWDNDDDEFNDMNIAMTGDMVIRIAQGTTVARGDLLMSAGDGTAKPQGDDIVRSKTIAKVTSTNVSHTYDDGSYLVPCVLMAC